MCIWTSQQWDQYFKYPFQYILDFLNLLRILPTAMWLDEYFFFFFFIAPGWPLEKNASAVATPRVFYEQPPWLLCVFPIYS